MTNFKDLEIVLYDDTIDNTQEKVNALLITLQNFNLNLSIDEALDFHHAIGRSIKRINHALEAGGFYNSKRIEQLQIIKCQLYLIQKNVAQKQWNQQK